jgi:hypothetical protein
MEVNMATTAQSKCTDELPRAERIAQLNDQLRTKGTGGQIMITRGVHALTGADVSRLLKALASFDEFDADSDPHGERDFGVFDFAGAELMWKVDYYSDEELRFGSNDPSNPDLTQRVLTVFLAEEY